MPEELTVKADGKLTQAQQQKLVDWIKTKGTMQPCPVCSKTDWSVGETLIRGDIFTQGVTNLGGPTYPLAFIACKNCAFMRHFLAGPIGLVEGIAAEDQADV